MSKGFDKILEDFEKGLLSKINEEQELNEHIVKVKGGYELKSKHGNKNLGKYPTKAGAEKREKQVQYFKHANESTFIESDSMEARLNDAMLQNLLDSLVDIRRMQNEAETVDDKEEADYYADKLFWDIEDLAKHLETYPEQALDPRIKQIYRLAMQARILGPQDIPGKVGFVESGELFRGETVDFNDPEILIHGYGRLLRSQLHKKIGGYLADMAQKANQGDLEAVKYMIEKSPLKDLVDAALDADKELNTPQMKRKATLAARKPR